MAGFRLQKRAAALIAVAAMLSSGGAAPAPTTPAQTADAKAQVAAAGIGCDVGSVRYLGTSNVKDAKGAPMKAEGYEVTCTNRFGYILLGPQGGSPETKAYACPAVAASSEKGSKNAKCELPENLPSNLAPTLQKIAAEAGLSTCTIANSKWRGMSKDGANYFEVTCTQTSPGYLLTVPKGPGAATVANCLQLQGAKCELTTEAQSGAWLTALAAKAGNACQVSGSRFVGESKTESTEYYEVGCGKAPGFMLALSPAGELKRTIPCAEAGNIAGGCTLTDAATVQASAAQTYGQRLQAIGVSCNIQKSEIRGTNPRTKGEVIEFSCSDRPAGLIVAFPGPAGGKPDVVDCFDGHHFGLQCDLTSKETLLGLLSKGMSASGKSCAVSNFANQGISDKNNPVIEVACGSAPGYIAEFSKDYSKALTTDTCAAAAKTADKTGLSCTLPGNH